MQGGGGGGDGAHGHRPAAVSIVLIWACFWLVFGLFLACFLVVFWLFFGLLLGCFWVAFWLHLRVDVGVDVGVGVGVPHGYLGEGLGVHRVRLGQHRHLYECKCM